ncbi:MAG TPA: glutamate-5-semialdehyde dehydrogenase [Tissierellia bacterium]|nr:glutamate-5-semialdehyde dehydrogenase [Tissierellia bacterium]
MISVCEIGRRAKSVKTDMAQLSKQDKNDALRRIAETIRQNSQLICRANRHDIQAAKQAGLSEALIDRLLLDEARIEGIARAVEEIIQLPDPVGQVLSGETMSEGMQLINVRVPLGVCGIIYEARPNVTVDAAALCLKAGNAVILKGGKEAIESNKALTRLMRQALEEVELPADCIQLIEDTSRQASIELMELRALDVLIPRGGAGLIASVVEHAKVPVIETGTGNNHLFVDATADLSQALDILINAKCQRPSVCNAIETLLVHRSIAEDFLPRVMTSMSERGVELRADEVARRVLSSAKALTQTDYATEFIDLILAVRVVDDIDQALDHIATYGTGHSEAIVTTDYDQARRFQQAVDAAAVYVNCSTRFTDGGEFGLGAEIGISTQKLHVRGPMGLVALTSNKYLISGNGQVRG